MKSTLDFYDNNAIELIDKYDHADLKQLHNIFKKYINKKDTVLDIGFGSGRDLIMIESITPDIFGLDSCATFVKNMEDKGFTGRVANCILPNIDFSKFEIPVSNFNVVISIAVFMHLDINEIKESLQNIKKILYKQGIFIISYSLERKAIDERHFEPLTKLLLTQILEEVGFIEIDSFHNYDVMNRDIEWITQVLVG